LKTDVSGLLQNMTGFEEIRCLDAPLADKLAAYGDQLLDVDPDIANAYSALVERLQAANAGAGAPEIGSPMPEFLLPDNDSKLIGSTNLLSAGPLIVSFNRGHWCKFCRLELLALAEIHPDVAHLGGEIVSIMPDSAAPIGRLKAAFDIPFPVLTDIDNGYALTCGLMISLGHAVGELYRTIGRDIADFQGNDAGFVPIPATFVIAADGQIGGRFIDADFRHRMAPDDILGCLRKIS